MVWRRNLERLFPPLGGRRKSEAPTLRQFYQDTDMERRRGEGRTILVIGCQGPAIPSILVPNGPDRKGHGEKLESWGTP